MATVNEIVQDIINQAKLLDPAISLEVGTPERKIVEAVAEQIAAAQVDISVLSQQHDIDQLAGIRLDAFMNNFGFARQLSTRSSGVVTISRTTAGVSSITIPRGTQFAAPATPTTPLLYFSSLETAVIAPDETIREIFVECTTPGTIGNVPSNSITAFSSAQAVGGFSFVTNTNPTSGGKDGESDESFKVRFKNTAFRHMSGTTDSYLALSVAQPGITKASVIGPQSKYVEYIQTHNQIDSVQARDFDTTGQRFPNKSTTTLSTVPNSKYTYSTGYSIQDPTNTYGDSFLRPNVDYVFNAPAWPHGASEGTPTGTIPPNFTMLNPDIVDPATIVPQVLLFEHYYISTASRNDWPSKILNCVDVYVNGKNSVKVTSREPVPAVSQKFSIDGNSPYYVNNYRRTKTHANPKTDSYLQVLFWQPVLSLPETIAVGSTIFAKNIDYFQIEDISELRGTERCRNGIEWTKNGYSKLLLALGTTDFMTLTYNYDSNIQELQQVINRNKQITSDPLVHKAKMRYIKLYLTVMYSPNTTPETVNKSIYTSVQGFLDGQYFGSAVQLSDILQAVHNTPGVDNVRWTYEANQDPNISKNKVEFVTSEGEQYATRQFSGKDFFLDDDELISLPNTVNRWDTALDIVVKAQNTWNG